jgi:hypothetical protein
MTSVKSRALENELKRANFREKDSEIIDQPIARKLAPGART